MAIISRFLRSDASTLQSWYSVDNMFPVSPATLAGLKAPGIQHGCWGLVWYAQLGSGFLEVLTQSPAANLLSSQSASCIPSFQTLLSIISIQRTRAPSKGHIEEGASMHSANTWGWVLLDDRAEWKWTAQMSQESAVCTIN